jgi:hypothetical protein
MRYPIEANAELVDAPMISWYTRTLFDFIDFEPDDYVVLRGIAERGTPHEGLKPTSVPVQPALVPLHEVAIAAARRWAQYHFATYIVPGVTKDPRATARSICLMTAVMVDLDQGDTRAKLDLAMQHWWQPSFIVESGGVTAEGTPKLHLYWLLPEPSDDIMRVMKQRDLLARALGGDRALGIAEHGDPLGRAHQPIRIPGTVHAKGGNAKLVRLVRNGRTH